LLRYIVGHNENGVELSVEDLLAGLGEHRSKLGAARKSLEKLSKKVSPLDAPLPGPIQERQERKAAYDESKKDIQKWMPLVKSHREAPTLKLSSNKSDVHKPTTVSSVAMKHKPGNNMELEVAAMLEAAGAHTASAVAESEDALAMRMLSAEEAKARREELAKQRALLFYHEVKAKRLKKIKSKEYRRRLKKAEKRKSQTATGEDGMLLLDEDELKQQREEAEYARAKERLTLKHKNTSRFIRRAIMRGSQHAPDESTREVIAEQLRLGEEIRKKVHAFKDQDSGSSSEDDSSDEEREDARISRKLESAAKDVLDDSDGPNEEKGLMSLPFMKRSMEKKRQAAVEHAKNVLGENDPEKIKTGRMVYGNANGVSNHTHSDVDPKEVVTEDEDEDAEAKYERLTKQKGYSVPMEPSKGQEFIHSKKFDGIKEGYLFTNGPKGVGYYSDVGSTKPSVEPSKAKQGNTNASKRKEKAKVLSQEELIKKAFAGDDVVEEFKKSKQEEVEGELPQEEVPGELPGWGTWSHQKKEPAWVQQAKAKAEAKTQAAARARKDAGMEYVVISEKWDSKNAKYKTQSVPYPFNSKETYERSLRQPLGKEFNTVDAFRNLTRPAIIKDNGVIIEPLKYSAAVGSHNNSQSMANRSSILQVQGGMAKRTSKKK
jgi:U3 small nucleolar RNA-associated protein 14